MELPKKIRKPLVEKKRRRRINDSLEQLKTILLHQNTALGHLAAAEGSAGCRPAKLEKADILEMTIQYIRQLQAAAAATTTGDCRPRSARRILGELGNVMPGRRTEDAQTRKRPEASGNPWRPW